MKIQYEEKFYTKDPHHYGSKEHTYYVDLKCVPCCEAAESAWNEGDVLEFMGSELGVQIAEYHEGWGSWYDDPIKVCPWCGVKITYERVKYTRVEYDCKDEVIPEQKRTVCTERNVELKP